MREAPETIYLQWTGPPGHEGITWCVDQINDDDVEYVKKAKADKRPELLMEVFELIDDQYGEGIKNGYWPTIAPLHKKLEKELADEQ